MIWPIAGILVGALLAINPIFRPRLSLEWGVIAWFVDLLLVLMLSSHPRGVRPAVLVAGLFMGIPCFVPEAPLARVLLMCCSALPFAIVTLQLFAPPNASYRERLACTFTWFGTKNMAGQSRVFDFRAMIRLVLATLTFAGATAIVMVVPHAGPWWVVRWLAGGVMILGFAEIISAVHRLLNAMTGIHSPALMASPHRSISLTEFWSKRWNPLASALVFRPVFTWLAQYSPGLAMFVVFLASGIAHALLTYMAAGRWGISLLCGSFFLVQPLLIAVERRIKVRRRLAAGRAWTLGVLTLVSPLIVEPALQLIEPSWGASDKVLPSTAVALGFALFVNLFFLLGALASLPTQGRATPLGASR